MYKNIPGQRQTLRRNIRREIMLTRIITAIVALIVFIGVLLLGEVPFTVAMGLVILFMLYEAYGAITKNCAVKVSGYITGLILMAGIVFSQFGLAMAMSITVAMVFLVFLHGKTDYKEIFSTQLMTVYVVLFMSYIPRLYSEMGIAVMAIIFIIAWGSDTAAYFCGTFLGKHKLIPHVSPKKTVEGAVGAVIITALLCVLYAYILAKCDYPLLKVGPQTIDYIMYALIGFVASALSQLGDLAASAIKRDAGIKDYGWIFPGHGGFMDRFDSVMFIAPIVYYLFLFVVA